MDVERLRETLRRAVMMQEAGIANNPAVVKQLAREIASDMRELLSEVEDPAENVSTPKSVEQSLRDSRALSLLQGPRPSVSSFTAGYNAAASGCLRDRRNSTEWLKGFDAFGVDMIRSESVRFV